MTLFYVKDVFFLLIVIFSFIKPILINCKDKFKSLIIVFDFHRTISSYKFVEVWDFCPYTGLHYRWLDICVKNIFLVYTKFENRYHTRLARDICMTIRIHFKSNMRFRKLDIASTFLWPLRRLFCWKSCFSFGSPSHFHFSVHLKGFFLQIWPSYF